MLKIKDDVDLKELEKFGFVYEERKILKHNSIYNWQDYLEVKTYEEREQIYIRALDRREITVYSTCGLAIDKLYDLIQARISRKSKRLKEKKKWVSIIQEAN